MSVAQAEFALLPKPETPDEREAIEGLSAQLLSAFESRLRLDPSLSRTLVSFQANKERPFYRWFKFKEAFSVGLVELLLARYGISSGRLLDPFGGMGTSLFSASALGIDADGIELLPIGQEIIRGRSTMEREFPEDAIERLSAWAAERPWERAHERVPLNVLRITRGAYPPETHDEIEAYLRCLMDEAAAVQTALRLALLCVLEQVSYTRKDGQYLRWDCRSGRRQGARPFDKGFIPSFGDAVSAKLREMVKDLRHESATPHLPLSFGEATGQVRLLPGSCLDVLPTLADGTYDAVITSPPYCNRYDYTRTYALELALLGVSERGMLNLRQQMLSCTVENREKDLMRMNSGWAEALRAVDREGLLQAIIRFLFNQRAGGHLNNTGIPRMVRGYFYEMACVIAECSRVLRSGAPMLMVNDNVRYAGVEIPVDLILSSIAERLGFEVESILVLPNGKGNSSQQMGAHGRVALRKCVYVWRKR